MATPLPHVVDSLDELPAALRDALTDSYEQGNDGKWHLAIQDGARTTSFFQAKKQAATILAEKKRITDITGDLSLDELRALVEGKGGKGDGGKGGADDAEKWRDRLAKAEAEWKKLHVDPLQTQLAETGKKLTKYERDDVVRSALIAAKVDPDKMDDALELAMKHVDVRGGKCVVLDASGEERVIAVDAFVAGEFKQKRGYLFLGTKAKGGDAKDTAGGSGTDRSAAVTEVDPTDYKAMWANAEKIAKGEVRVAGGDAD